MDMKKREERFQLIKKHMMEKYKENLDNFSKNLEVDMDVAWAMFLCNAKAYANGATKPVIEGGGEVDVAELVKDYNELAQLIIWQ